MLVRRYNIILSTDFHILYFLVYMSWCIFVYAGLFPFEIARSEVVTGRHNIRLFQRRAGEPIPDQILGGAQFQIDRKLEHSRNIEVHSSL